MTISIKPLSENTLRDFLDFFDNMDFPDHPDWKKCYCYSYHFTGTAEEWEEEGKNRAAAIDLIRKNHMRGYLAYDEARPIGWCNVNDRQNYEGLKQSINIRDDVEGRVGAIVCFVVNPAYRRRGVAAQMLERICADYLEAGYACLEAYPGKNITNDEENYHGPEALYFKSGFVSVEDCIEYSVVRKILNQPGSGAQPE